MRSSFHGRGVSFILALVVLLAARPAIRADDKDWSTYNYDVKGYRFNRGESAISPANAEQLELKWRFPPPDSNLDIGVVHATPSVVQGCVYFGTATDARFYKLAPDGRLLWSYRNPELGLTEPVADQETKEQRQIRFQAATGGVMGSALVHDDTVYFGDLDGWLYALDANTGQERWKLNARDPKFPGAHPLNWFMASPIMADGKLIMAGGSLEQIISVIPMWKGNTGRGFVMAVEPRDGTILWKYDVGPEPKPLDPPLVIEDSWGKHTFYYGPATSSVWCTPSFDAASGTIFFGTDVNTAARRPTKDDPRLETPQSCAVIALSVKDGGEKWVTQLNPGDVWTNAMRSYDPKAGRYKDCSIGDTPKVYSIEEHGKTVPVVGAGCKNGGFYVLNAADGKIVAQTPVYSGPPSYPLSPTPDPRMLALPSAIGGLQTGCATDGKTIFTNGIDAVLLGSQELARNSTQPPTGGRVVALSLDTHTERWRHERPKLAEIGGPSPKPVFHDVGDPVASGVAVANGVVFFTTTASGKLVALHAGTGHVLKEFEIGPVWAGPSVSRGRVYVGSGNTLFSPTDSDNFFPKRFTGAVYSFGLPGEDEVSRLKSGG